MRLEGSFTTQSGTLQSYPFRRTEQRFFSLSFSDFIFLVAQSDRVRTDDRDRSLFDRLHRRRRPGASCRAPAPRSGRPYRLSNRRPLCRSFRPLRRVPSWRPRSPASSPAVRPILAVKTHVTTKMLFFRFSEIRAPGNFRRSTTKARSTFSTGASPNLPPFVVNSPVEYRFCSNSPLFPSLPFSVLFAD